MAKKNKRSQVRKPLEVFSLVVYGFNRLTTVKTCDHRKPPEKRFLGVFYLPKEAMRQTVGLLTEIKGWTPVIDALTKEFGLVTAAVYGVVWRYCQMDDRVCRASLEVIGDHLNIDKATVMRHIKVLCENGYLRDATPDRRNAPHVYVDTGKLKIVGLIEAVSTEKSRTKRGQTVAQDNSLQDKNSQTVAQCNATVAQCNATVAESQLKKEKRIKKERETPQKSPPPYIDTPTPRPGVNLAYKVYTEETGNGAHANKQSIKAMEQVTNLELWRSVVRRWLLCGWKPGNIQGMLDYYDRGQLPGDKPKESAPPGPTLSPDKLAAWEQLQKESMQ